MLFVPPTDPTRATIFAAYEKARSNYEPVGINVGDMGAECDRALWYAFRRASSSEVIEGRKLRIFDTGDIEETRILDDLRSIGCAVGWKQAKVRFVGGHVRGKIDAEAEGLPIHPPRLLVECKSSNERGFKEVVKKGCKEAKPYHYVQCQLYMHGRSLPTCLYVVVNKNDDDIHTELIPYDSEFCLRQLARAERIIRNDDPPSKLHEDPNAKAAFVCKMCRHKGVCHDGDWPRRNCRTCIHATPILTSENACWDCAKHAKPLTLDEQAAGCPDHLFIPALVPGKQIDADPENSTVTYTLHTGETWVNGRAE
jgi:hypothetical protein